MSMVDDDGVYVSQRRRVQRRKKALVAVAGLAAVLGGGAYGVYAWGAARDVAVIGEAGALSPVVAPSRHAPSTVSPSPKPSKSAGSPSPSVRPTSGSPSPSVRRTVARLSGVPQSALPSPTPTAAGPADEAVAAAQVSRLLQVPRVIPSDTLVAAEQAIVVAKESAPDGSAIRVVSARYDLTARGILWAADNGRPINGARCTQNLLVDKVVQVRPGMMLCWRADAGKSVVSVATSRTGRPAAALSAAAIDRAWRRLG
nr:hypothetical protein [uncultured Actinoplanes sp.]